MKGKSIEWASIITQLPSHIVYKFRGIILFVSLTELFIFFPNGIKVQNTFQGS